MVFSPIDLQGVLTVDILSAKGVRKASTWFAPALSAMTGARGGMGDAEAKVSRFARFCKLLNLIC